MATILHTAMHGRFTTGAWAGEIAQITHQWTVAEDDPTTVKLVNADIEEFTYDGTAATGSYSNGNYVQGFGGVLDLTVQTAIANAYQNLANVFDDYQSSAFRWERVTEMLVTYDAIPPTTGWGQIEETSSFVWTNPVAGDLTSVMGPPQCAVAISHVTGGVGSRNRGRIYVPFHQNVGATQLLTSTVQTQLNNGANAFFDAMAAISVDGGALHLIPAVVSRTHVSYSTITETRVSDAVDIQRRRANGRTSTYADLLWP